MLAYAAKGGLHTNDAGKTTCAVFRIFSRWICFQHATEPFNQVRYLSCEKATNRAVPGLQTSCHLSSLNGNLPLAASS